LTQQHELHRNLLTSEVVWLAAHVCLMPWGGKGLTAFLSHLQQQQQQQQQPYLALVCSSWHHASVAMIQPEQATLAPHCVAIQIFAKLSMM
jgi:hypothetical protein